MKLRRDFAQVRDIRQLQELLADWWVELNHMEHESGNKKLSFNYDAVRDTVEFFVNEKPVTKRSRA